MNKFDYLRFKGKMFIKQGEFKKAIDNLKDAILIKPTNTFYYNIIAETYRDLAIAYNKANLTKNALKMNLMSIKFYERSENKEKRDIQNYINTLLSISNIYYENQKYEDAKRYLNKILKIEKANHKALYYLVIINFKKGYLKDAEKLIFKVFSIYKDNNLDLYYWLIRLYSKQNYKTKLYRYLLKATKEEHSFFIKYYWPDNTFNIKIINKYLKFLKKELDKYETKALYNTIIYLSIQTQNIQYAKEMINKMEKKFFEDKDIYYWKIIFNIKEDNFIEARRLHNNIMKKWPNFIDQYDWNEVTYDVDQIKEILL